MASIPGAHDGEPSPTSRTSRPRVPRAPGDYVDPNRFVEMWYARSRFCEAVTRFAPECLDDLFRHAHLVDPLRQGSPSAGDMHAIVAALTAWGDRWNIRPLWMFQSALLSLLVVTEARAVSGRDVPPQLRAYPVTGDRFGPHLSTLLEIVNPGWHDEGLTVTIPSFTIAWHPTRGRRQDVIAATLGEIERQLSSAFDDMEAMLESRGHVPSGDPLAANWFEWTVKRVVLGRSLRSLAVETGRTRAGIRAGTQTLCTLIGLACPE